jgi:murein peptide amidase A
VTPAELLPYFLAPPWLEHGRSLAGRPLTHRIWRATTLGAPPVLFHGSIHGNEPLGSYCLRWLAEELDGEIHPLARDVWIAPVVNPDGFVLGLKNNDRGVDLNRNWPAQNWSRVYKGNEYPGDHPASEPETQALGELIARAQPIRIVALHSPFRTVNYDGPARELAERMAAKNGYGASADIGYPTPGSFGTLYGVEQHLEVITLEIPPMSPEMAWQENREALYEALAP